MFGNREQVIFGAVSVGVMFLLAFFGSAVGAKSQTLACRFPAGISLLATSQAAATCMEGQDACGLWRYHGRVVREPDVLSGRFISADGSAIFGFAMNRDRTAALVFTDARTGAQTAPLRGTCHVMQDAPAAPPVAQVQP